ncbi:bZIP transcription factor [Endozoicomonas ascidiicola]|uniref:bZIP transcription factor n=1 Tax=Endozoicomonas ascidiicola TaxID=1698521 RepID=UPI000831F676|nr:bZIP transcription factor [Endozoicomonas ascidiicola]
MDGLSNIHGTHDKCYQVGSVSGLNAEGGVKKASDYHSGRWNNSTVHIVPDKAHNSYNVVGMEAFQVADQQFPVSVPVDKKHASSALSMSLNMPSVAKASVPPMYNQAIEKSVTLNKSYPGAESSMPENAFDDHSARAMDLTVRRPVIDLKVNEENVPSISSLTNEEKYKRSRGKNKAACRGWRAKTKLHREEQETKVHKLNKDNEELRLRIQELREEKNKVEAKVHVMLGIKK